MLYGGDWWLIVVFLKFFASVRELSGGSAFGLVIRVGVEIIRPRLSVDGDPREYRWLLLIDWLLTKKSQFELPVEN